MEVYAWLIDLIHRGKNCPTGMISGWVQKVTQHNGIIQNQGTNYYSKTEFLPGEIIEQKGKLTPIETLHAP